MSQIALGDVTIADVVEMYLYAQPGYLLPDSTPEALAAHMPWLRPRYVREDGAFILPVRTHVIRTRHFTILVDTCVGNHKQRRMPEANMRSGSAYLEGLRSIGVVPEQVDFVMCTHLHFDHVGWNTRLCDGRWVPTFPNARYLFARREWEHVRHTESPVQRTVMQDSLVPVLDAGLAELVDTNHVIDDGVQLVPLPGHTPGHVGLRLISQGKEAVLTGDMMHHPVQVAEPQWSSMACDDPAGSAETRQAFVERAADADVLVLAAHFNAEAGGRIIRKNGGYRFVE